MTEDPIPFVPTKKANLANVYSGALTYIREQRDDARRWAVHLEQENARIWTLAACPICGNGADTPDERDEFLEYGAHLGCAADAAHDAETAWGCEQ